MGTWGTWGIGEQANTWNIRAMDFELQSLIDLLDSIVRLLNCSIIQLFNYSFVPPVPISLPDKE